MTLASRRYDATSRRYDDASRHDVVEQNLVGKIFETNDSWARERVVGKSLFTFNFESVNY